METIIVAMEQLVEKLTNEMNILRKENQALRYDNQDSMHRGDLKVGEHQE